MMSLRILVCLVLVTLTTGMRWEGQDRGGGDEVGLEFLSIAQSTLRDLEKNHRFLYQQVKTVDLESVLDNLRVLTVDTALKVTVGTLTQDSIAVNDRSEQVILVNRKRWKSITDKRVKAGIVLHEILSLAGLEETGFYPISSRYVTALGVPSDSIKPIKDSDQTYLSCVDTKSVLLVLSISPTYRLKTEIRALGDRNLRLLRNFANVWGIEGWDQVVAVSFSIQAKIMAPWADKGADEFCRLDLYNRAILNCSDNSGSRREAREFEFKLQDGSVVKATGEGIWFDISENAVKERLEMRLVADLPHLADGDAGTVFLSFPLNPQSCR